MRLLGKKLVLLATSLAVTAVVAEVALRALGYYGFRVGKTRTVELRDDPVVDYRHAAGARWVEDGVAFATNRSGFRDDDHALEKPPGVRRLLVIGDSVTEGYGVAFDDTYPRRLEAELKQRGGGDWEVVTIALDGLNTAQEAHLLRNEGVRFDPDVIVIGYVLNDPERATSYAAELDDRARQSPFTTVKRAARRSSLLYLVYSGGQRLWWRLRVVAGLEAEADYIADDYFRRLHADPERWASVLAGLDEVRAVAAERQAPVVLVVFPALHDLARYGWADLHHEVAAAARARAMTVLDLLPVYQGQRAAELQVDSGDHVHPNALGHRLAAEALAELLLGGSWSAPQRAES